MDGFLRSGARRRRSRSATTPSRTCPSSPRAAQAFTAYDRFFCSLLSSTYPNREYMHAAQSYGMTDNTLPRTGRVPGHDDLRRAARQGRVQPLLLHRPARVGAVGRARARALGPRAGVLRALRERQAARALVRRPVVRGRGAAAPRATSTRTATFAPARRSWPTWCTRSWSRRSGSAARCSSSTTSGAASSTTCAPPRVPDDRSSADLTKDFGQMGFRIPAVAVSPYARRGHVDHTIYGFESILKMIEYRYGLAAADARATSTRATSRARSTSSRSRGSTCRTCPPRPT